MNSAVLSLVILATLGCVVADVICRVRAFRIAGRKLRMGEMVATSLGRQTDLKADATRMIRLSMLARLGSYIGIVIVLVKLAAA